MEFKMEKISVEKLKQTAKVKNFLTGEEGTMIPLSKENEISDADYTRIVEICNSQKVYDFLFRARLNGKPYNLDGAKYWVQGMGWKGWEEGTIFIYIVRNKKGNIVAAIDIKSPDVDAAEIGYWASEEDKGWVTNSVLELMKLAKVAGYIRLISLALPNNLPSQNVLLRSGFSFVGPFDRKGVEYIQYSINL
jgi:RimJ/RimL family protein N-acetyltransferase